MSCNPNAELPSGNQTWQWKIHYLSVIFLSKLPFLGGFSSQPCLIPRGCPELSGSSGSMASSVALVENKTPTAQRTSFTSLQVSWLCASTVQRWNGEIFRCLEGDRSKKFLSYPRQKDIKKFPGYHMFQPY